MNKVFRKVKLFLALVLTSVIFLGNNINVNAAAQTISLGSGTQVDAYLAGIKMKTKVTTDGQLVYCLDRSKTTAQNVKATLVGELDAGFAYLIQNGYPHKNITGDNMKDYYITQTAIWWYLDETTGSGNLGADFKVNAEDPHGVRNHIKNLVANAKKAKEQGYTTTTISVNTNTTDMKLTSDKKYYVSEPITVTGTNISKYKVTVSSGLITTDEQGNEKTTFTETEKFIVKVPVSKLSGTKANVKVTVSADATVNKVYEYKPENTKMQNALPAILTPATETVSKVINLSITSTKVAIVKLDKTTGQLLPGAELVLKDAAGNIITSWISTTNMHVVRNLSNGTYIVEEKKAPTGYKKLTQPVMFTITDEDTNQVIKIENEPKVSVVTITKLDKSTEKPLAGATLVVRNEAGEEVARFVTTTESYALTGLPNGTYTVSEEQAPAGYQKVNDTIKFTISDENQSYQVNFYNYPIVTVPDTATNSSLIMTIIGLVIISSTAAFVYKYVHR